MNVTISIPGSWEGFITVEERATEWRGQPGEPAFIALQAAIDAGTWRKVGKGQTVIVELDDIAQVTALAEEAKYQDEYWNTDLYGIKEAGSSCSTRGRAARVVRERVDALMQEVTS